MKGRSGRLWGLGLALVAVAVVLCALHLSSATRPLVYVTVHSRPEGASVFAPDCSLGCTPLRLCLARGERRVLRFVRRDHNDAEAVINADAFIPQGWLGQWRWLLQDKEVAVTVKLGSAADAMLLVTTEPDGTEVFLDGRRVGVSPVSLRGLTPGPHGLRLVHPEAFVQSESIMLQPGQETRVHRVMETTKVVAYYRDLIRREPALLTHYAELAHHHVLNGQFADAAEVLREGFEALKRSDVDPQTTRRYFVELEQIYRRYFIYPPETANNKIRPVCRALLEMALDKGLGPAREMQEQLKRLDTYDKDHPPS